MAIATEYDRDLSDNSDVTFILFFDFVYFSKNTNFSQTHVTRVESTYFPQLFTFFSSCTIHDQKEAFVMVMVNNNVKTAVFQAPCIKNN